MQLDEVFEQALDVIERVRAVIVPRKLDELPDLLVGGALLDALELTLKALELTGQPRALRSGGCADGSAARADEPRLHPA